MPYKKNREQKLFCKFTGFELASHGCVKCEHFIKNGLFESFVVCSKEPIDVVPQSLKEHHPDYFYGFYTDPRTNSKKGHTGSVCSMQSRGEQTYVKDTFHGKSAEIHDLKREIDALKKENRRLMLVLNFYKGEVKTLTEQLDFFAKRTGTLRTEVNELKEKLEAENYTNQSYAECLNKRRAEVNELKEERTANVNMIEALERKCEDLEIASRLTNETRRSPAQVKEVLDLRAQVETLKEKLEKQTPNDYFIEENGRLKKRVLDLNNEHGIKDALLKGRLIAIKSLRDENSLLKSENVKCPLK